MFETEDEFDSVIKQEWGLPIVYDGITNIDEYTKAPIKILWILKEGNEGEKQEERYHRDFHLDDHIVVYYSRWKSTYKNIILTTYGILYNIPYKHIPSLSEDSTVNGEYMLNKIALINVNKNGGGGSSNRNVIEANYTKHKNILLQQIDGINPDIIINCSRVKRLYEDVAEKYGMEKKQFTSEFELKVNFAENSSKLLIDYWHPNVRSYYVSSEAYQKQIIDIYKMWKKSK
jgi:hypothetical protein